MPKYHRFLVFQNQNHFHGFEICSIFFSSLNFFIPYILVLCFENSYFIPKHSVTISDFFRRLNPEDENCSLKIDNYVVCTNYISFYYRYRHFG
ncbi:hypothetical protein BGP_1419 [Beggiatoa sp. PS]|nr:hypothetical protein BGP_1419 [Beggiatoa sp. PS]